MIGEGSFGSVVKAKCLKTGKLVAIKLIKDIKTSAHARSLLREIVILRKLSEMENNQFFTQIIDVILPEGMSDTSIFEQANNSIKTQPTSAFSGEQIHSEA